MDNVTIRKDVLKEKLQENLAIHDEIYEEAVENYWKSVTKDFKEKVEEVNGLIKKQDLTHGGISIGIRISAPENHREAYEDVLSMLEYEVDDEVTLSQHDFKSYVLNQWQWSNQFLMSNAVYASQDSISKFHG